MKSILLIALSAIILSQSYGFVYADHEGNSHVNFQVASESSEVPIITIETDASSYKTGDIVHVYGSVSDYNEEDPYKNFDVALRVIASNNNIISISQIPLDVMVLILHLFLLAVLYGSLTVITQYPRATAQTGVYQ